MLRPLLPGYARSGALQMKEISELQDVPVIIAGFGQIIGRLLLAQGIAHTLLDHPAEMVEAVRAFGYRVFYGVASRLDLMRTAGAATAKILVVAVDDVDQSLKIVDLVKEHFPQLQTVASARDVTHWNALRNRGVMRVERELLESSLRTSSGSAES